MDAIGLNGSGNMNEVFVEHGDEGGVVLGGERGEDLVEGLDIVGAIVGREGDAGQQDFDVRAFEHGQNLVEIVAGHIGGQAAKTVVAAELHDDDFGVQAQDGADVGKGVFSGGATGALIDDFIVIAGGVEFLLQKVGVGLAGREAVSGGDAVSKADQDGAVGGKQRAGEDQKPD